MVDLIQGLSGNFFLENPRRSPDHFCHKISIERIALHPVPILRSIQENIRTEKLRSEYFPVSTELIGQ